MAPAATNVNVSTFDAVYDFPTQYCDFLILIWIDSLFDMDGTLVRLHSIKFCITYHDLQVNAMAAIEAALMSLSQTYPGLDVRKIFTRKR